MQDEIWDMVAAVQFYLEHWVPIQAHITAIQKAGGATA